MSKLVASAQIQRQKLLRLRKEGPNIKALNRQSKLRLILYSFYALIALFPVITFFSSFSTSLRFLIDREIEVQSQLSHAGLDTIHSSLLYADSYTDSLISTGYTQSYIAASSEPRNQLVSRIQKMHDAFPLLSDQNDLLSRVYIYSRNSDSILDRYSAYLNLERHYEKLFKLSDLSAEEWKHVVLQNRAYSTFLSTKDEAGKAAIIYNRQLPAYPTTGGRIVFYLDANRLLNLLAGDTSKEIQRSVHLYDEVGTLLLASHDHDESDNLFTRFGSIDGHLEIKGADGKKQILFSSALTDYGFTLYTGIPKAYFTAHALRMSAATLRIILPFSLLSFVLLFFILRYSHDPLSAAITSVPDTVVIETLNPFKYVAQSLHHLSDVSRQQELLLQNSRMEMQEAILSMLVYQKKTPNFPLEEKLAEYGISYDAACFRALILVLRDTESGDPLPISSHMHLKLLELAMRCAPQIRYVKMDGPDQMLFLSLLNDSEERTDQLHVSLSSLCWEINQAINCDVRIYIGNETESIEEIYYSFKLARELMVSSVSAAAGCLVFSPSQGPSPVYDYTSEDARYLRQKAGMGNAQAVFDRLHELYLRNSGNHIRSAFERQLMYGHMISTLLEAGYQGELSKELTRGLAELPPDRFFDLLGTYYQTLCQQNQASEQQEEQQLICAILEEIQAQLGDYNLTQAPIAMKFGLTERKLSALVREQTGMTFAKYLEKQRIARSLELLQKGELTIEEIALAVGYGSDKSFRRAFKQVMNCPPSDYKT